MLTPANQDRLDNANDLLDQAVNQLLNRGKSTLVVTLLSASLDAWDSIDQSFYAGSADVDVADAISYLDGSLCKRPNRKAALVLIEGVKFYCLD